MGNLVSELRNDHIKCSKILDRLAEQLEIIHKGKSADYHLMLDAVCYLENYPDYVFVALEDVIFNESTEDSLFDELNETFKQFHTENHEIKALTHSLHDYINAALDGGVIEREPFEKQIETCIQRQRDHMNTEECLIFPLLNAH